MPIVRILHTVCIIDDENKSYPQAVKLQWDRMNYWVKTFKIKTEIVCGKIEYEKHNKEKRVLSLNDQKRAQYLLCGTTAFKKNNKNEENKYSAHPEFK